MCWRQPQDGGAAALGQFELANAQSNIRLFVALIQTLPPNPHPRLLLRRKKTPKIERSCLEGQAVETNGWNRPVFPFSSAKCLSPS